MTMTNSRPADEQLSEERDSEELTSLGLSGLSVAAVARRLGVAPATLRTWDRRYGLGPSEHSAGSHRRYSEDDLMRLMIMRSLALEGVAPAEAARTALAADLSQTPLGELETQLTESLQRELEDEANQQSKSSGVRPLYPKAVNISEPEESIDLSPLPIRKVGETLPNAQVIKVPFLRVTDDNGIDTQLISDLVDAVLRGNIDNCRRILHLDVDNDPLQWWVSLVEPTLNQLALRTVLAQPGEAPETLLSTVALGELKRFVQATEQRKYGLAPGGTLHPSQMRNIVLLFGAPDDPRPLAMHALGAALLARSVTTRLVTGPARVRRTVELVTMVRPVATVLVTSLTKPELGIVHALHESNPELPIFVNTSSQEAVTDLPLSQNVTRVRSFEALVHEVVAVTNFVKSQN